MTQEIKEKLAKLNDAANDISHQLWQISEDENFTKEEHDLIKYYALDADQLAFNIKQMI